MSTSGIADESTAVGSTTGLQTRSLVPALTIVSHPVAHRVGERLVFEPGRDLLLSRAQGDFCKPGQQLGHPLLDPFLSRQPIRLSLRPHGGVKLTVDPGGTKVVVGSLGTHSNELSSREIESKELTLDELSAGVPIELARRVVLLLHWFDRDIRDTTDRLGMVGESTGIRRVRMAIERVVDLAVPVLIRGETGTGKDLVARAIHDRSPRRDRPYVSVNLGALSRELAPAELFGSTRGAYTGATREREGLFRAAQGGTLFLDEMGEAAPDVQAMLLRVLETGEMYPVGADRPVAVQVSVIAATDANLEEQIRDGRFKAPLFHRLSGYEVRIPPLRERREDIGMLLYHFAREELATVGELHRLGDDLHAKPWLPAQLAVQLVLSAWPGNIRQLRNLTRQLVIESRGLAQIQLDPRRAEELTGTVWTPSTEALAPLALGTLKRRKPSAVTEAELLEALRGCAWDLKAAADRLRIPRPSIYDLIDKCPDIRTAGDLTSDEITACFRACVGDLDAMVMQLQVSKRALSRRVKELGLLRNG